MPELSGGFDVGFVGNNSGPLEFNQVFANASGRLNVSIGTPTETAAARDAVNFDARAARRIEPTNARCLPVPQLPWVPLVPQVPGLVPQVLEPGAPPPRCLVSLAHPSAPHPPTSTHSAKGPDCSALGRAM